MRGLLARVARTVRRAGPASRGETIAVAVSGGSDSVALTWLLRALEADTGLRPAGLIHVNHQLRGAASDEDAAFCRALAARLAVPIDVTTVDVAALARAGRQSVEAAARRARYAAYADAAARLGATLVATGHTMDDQAETVLLRLLRGAGSRGLSAIRVRRGRYIRPLLDCRRADLRAYLTERGLDWREDASNADVSILRNRVRHELMPRVEAIFPGGVRALARAAALAEADETFLMTAAIKSRATVVVSSGAPGSLTEASVDLDVRALSQLPAALARRVVRSVVEDAAPGVALSARHLVAVCRLAGTDKASGHLDLPGVSVERSAGVLTVSPALKADRIPPAPNGARWPVRPLDLPGRVRVPEAGLEIGVAAGAGPAGVGPADEGVAHGRLVAQVQADAVKLPLAVRNRRPGDRLRPLGAPGRRKLQDVFVDRKVPRTERDRVAVVVDRDDRIVWVAGVTIAEECRVTAPERGVLILEQRTVQ